MNFNDQPKIYVACLASYNAGELHGVWIDATQDLEDIRENIRAMLDASSEPDSEEYAVHDYEGFQGIEIHEYDSIEHIVELAYFIQDHGRLGAEVLNYYGGDLQETREVFERYVGVYDCLGDFARELTDETSIPDHIVPYVDFDAMGRDIELNGDILAFELGYQNIHIFWSR